MKSFLILFLSLVFSNRVYTQQQPIDTCNFCCLYTHYVQTLDPEGKPAVDSLFSVLQVGSKFYKYENLSQYVYNKNFMPDSMLADAVYRSSGKSDESFTIYQNYPDFQQLTVREALHPTYYVYREEPFKLAWTLFSDTLVVMGYKCYKATTNYGGKTWTAWYTDEIAIPSGPWKFGGLPGLILQAEDNENKHLFKAFTIFDTSNQEIVYEGQARDEKTDRNKFIKQRNKLKSHPLWLKMPYYYDSGQKQLFKYRNESIKKMGVSPFWVVNGIKYPARILENDDVIFYYNEYRPLEVK